MFIKSKIDTYNNSKVFTLTVLTGVSPFLGKDRVKLFRGDLSATKHHGFGRS